jgi:hypothetical protein
VFEIAVPSPLHDTAVQAAHIGAAAAPRLGGSIGCTDYGSDGRHRGHHDHKLLHEQPLSLAVKIRPEVFLLFPKGPFSFSGAPLYPGHVILMRGSNDIYPHARFQWYFE